MSEQSPDGWNTNPRDLWVPREKTARRPKGFKESEDGTQWVPIPEVCLLLSQAFDQTEAGISVRGAVEWYNDQVTQLGYENENLSHEGLRKVRKEARPDYKPKTNPGNKLKEKHVPRERRKELVRISKIGMEKRRILAAQKRIAKKEAELAVLRKEEYEKREVREAAVIERSDRDIDAVIEQVEDEREVAFRPNPGPQSEFLAASEQEVLYGGAAGGGKSYAMIADPLRYVHNKNFNGLLLRRTNDELREIIWNSQDVYKRAFGKTATWSEKKSLWTFDSGARLWMTYLERDEDVMRYHGQAFTWIGVDELTQYSTPFSWNYLRTRLRTPDPTLPLVMRATTNPGGPGHGWVKRMFIDPAPWNTAFWATDIDTGEQLKYPKGHEKEGQTLFQRRFIPAKLSDNPYLYKDGLYEANLMSQSEGLRRQLLEGDWSIAEGAAFPEFRYHLHTCKPFPIPDTWRRFRSADYGYASFSAVHWYAIDPDGTLYVYREKYVTKHTGTDLGRMIIEQEAKERVDYGVLDSSTWAQRGTSGPSVAEEILRTGCRFRPSDRSKGSREAGFTRLHELLKVNEVTGKPGIIFFDTCRQIIADLPIIPLSKDVIDDIDLDYVSDHAYDSIRYGIQSRPKAFSVFDFGNAPKRDGYYRPVDKTFGY